jgi:hypothetical protein
MCEHACACVCMCVCTYMHVWITFHVCILPHACAHACICAGAHAYVYFCTHMHLCIRVILYVHPYMHSCICCDYIRTYVYCKYTHTYDTYVRTYVYCAHPVAITIALWNVGTISMSFKFVGCILCPCHCRCDGRWLNTPKCNLVIEGPLINLWQLILHDLHVCVAKTELVKLPYFISYVQWVQYGWADSLL